MSEFDMNADFMQRLKAYVEAETDRSLPTPACIETPYRGKNMQSHETLSAQERQERVQAYEAVIEYADLCMLVALRSGYAPFASHLLFTRVLDDNDPASRTAGINAGTAIALKLGLLLVFTDMGVTQGMFTRITLFESLQLPVMKIELNATTFAQMGILRPTGVAMLR